MVLKELLEIIQKQHPVQLVPKSKDEVDTIDFRDHVSFLVERFNLKETYGGHTKGINCDKKRAGEENYITYTVRFFDEHSAGQFYSEVNDDPTLMYTARFPEPDEGLMGLIPIKRIDKPEEE